MKLILIVLATCALTAFSANSAPHKSGQPAAVAPARKPLPTDFLGVTMGSKFEMPECAIRTFPYGAGSVYEHASDKTTIPCWYTNRPGSIDGRPEGDAFEVKVNLANVPDFVGGVELLVLNGQIEGISFNTGGLRVQASLLAALTDKLGAPTKTEQVEKQNGIGATFTSLNAHWMFTNGEAHLFGIGSRPDRGFGSVHTSVGAAHLAKKFTPKGSF